LFFNRSNDYAKELIIKIGIPSRDIFSSRSVVHIDDIRINGGGSFVQSNTFDENTNRVE